MPVKNWREITIKRARVYNIKLVKEKKLRKFEEKVEKYWFFFKKQSSIQKKASKKGDIIEKSGETGSKGNVWKYY